jgi:SAM-dependent methyltransferase
MPDGSGDRFPEDYERGRPGWPHEAVELLDLPPTTTALDLGAGTGKLTRLLVEGFDRVVAVEPAAAMRRVLVTLCPQAEICAGQARSIPLRDRSAGAVFAAEAFHWFDDDHALAEIARVLRVDAPLLLLWNLPAGPWEPLDHDPFDLDGPRRGDGEWRGSFVGAGFEPLRDTRIPNEQTLDRDGLVWRASTRGGWDYGYVWHQGDPPGVRPREVCRLAGALRGESGNPLSQGSKPTSGYPQQHTDALSESTGLLPS